MSNSDSNQNLIQHSHSVVQFRLLTQTELHKKIRNDDDYDDWSYGLEPSYVKSS